MATVRARASRPMQLVLLVLLTVLGATPVPPDAPRPGDCLASASAAVEPGRSCASRAGTRPAAGPCGPAQRVLPLTMATRPAPPPGTTGDRPARPSFLEPRSSQGPPVLA